MGKDILTAENLRQHLADQVPGFAQVLAEALNKEPSDLLRLIEGGQVSKTEALAALGRLVIALQRDLVLAGEDIIDRSGTVQELREYRAAHGLPDN